MLRGQCGTADSTEASWAKAAKSSDPVSEAGYCTGKQERFKSNISVQVDSGVSQLWAKQGSGLHYQEAFRLFLILVHRSTSVYAELPFPPF